MRWKALVVAWLLAACAPVTSPPTTTIPGPATSTAASPSTTSLPAPDTTLSRSGCAEGDDLVDAGQVGRIDQPTTDSTILGHISWEADEGCERFRIDFETAEGAPATTPPTVSASFLVTGQILRVRVGLDTTVISDQLVETSLVDRLYVVRSLDGGLFIDLHLSSPTLARIDVENSPAALLVELEPGIEPFLGSATISERTVVTEPVAGAQTGPTVEVAGYARTFEANVVVIATNDGVGEGQSTQAADWTETWGEFRTNLTLPPGPTSLFVGEESPDDGSLDGVIVAITVQ